MNGWNKLKFSLEYLEEKLNFGAKENLASAVWSACVQLCHMLAVGATGWLAFLVTRTSTTFAGCMTSVAVR